MGSFNLDQERREYPATTVPPAGRVQKRGFVIIVEGTYPFCERFRPRPRTHTTTGGGGLAAREYTPEGGARVMVSFPCPSLFVLDPAAPQSATKTATFPWERSCSLFLRV